MSRIGGLIAPAVVGLRPAFVPLLIFGSLSLVSGLLVCLLPETLGSPLPQRMSDVEEMGTSKKWWEWRGRAKKESGSETDTSADKF